MYLVINKCVTAVKVSNFSGHYLPNRSTLDIGVLGYIGIVQHNEHSPEVWSIPPGTPCICTRNGSFCTYYVHCLATGRPLRTESNLFHLKTQFVPRCKHSSFAAYSEEHIKQMNALCGQNVGFVNVKRGGT